MVHRSQSSAWRMFPPSFHASQRRFDYICRRNHIVKPFKILLHEIENRDRNVNGDRQRQGMPRSTENQSTRGNTLLHNNKQQEKRFRFWHLQAMDGWLNAPKRWFHNTATRHYGWPSSWLRTKKYKIELLALVLLIVNTAKYSSQRNKQFEGSPRRAWTVLRLLGMRSLGGNLQ